MSNLTYRRRRTGATANRNRRRLVTEKVAMLRMRDLIVFKYNIRQILDESSLDEMTVNAFVANLVTKASRGSIAEAKEYVKEITEQGVLSDDIAKRVLYLLDRNRKYR